jgi:hypothetical protein
LSSLKKKSVIPSTLWLGASHAIKYEEHHALILKSYPQRGERSRRQSVLEEVEKEKHRRVEEGR